MGNFKIKLKEFLLHFLGYFFLLNGLKIIFRLKNISLLKVLRSENSLEDKISEIQIQNPDQSAGMLISDFVFITENLPYFVILFGFVIVWIFGKRRKYILQNFILSFLLLLFFERALWKIVQPVFNKPFEIFENLYLELIFSGISLILLSVISFYYSPRKNTVIPND